jgi:hypothetical protein
MTPEPAAEEPHRARRPPIRPLKKLSGQNGTRFGRKKSSEGQTALVLAAEKVFRPKRHSFWPLKKFSGQSGTRFGR